MSNCHGWNVALENPPTHKHRDGVSHGNFCMDAAPNNSNNKYLLNARRKLSIHKALKVVLDVFWTPYVHSIYALCPEGSFSINFRDNRVQISSSHFAKYEGILSFCEALSQRNNKNAKLSILFFAPKFHLVTVIFKHDNVLQKHLIPWHNLILQLPRQANFREVYLTSFMFCFEFFIFLSHSLLYNCQLTVTFTGSCLNASNFYGTMLFCHTILRLKLDVPWGHIEAKKLYSPWHRKVFNGFSLIIASKM